MKFIICLLLTSQFAYANKSSEWTPKYQKTNLKKLDQDILKLTPSKKFKKIGSKKSAKVSSKSKKMSIIPDTPLEGLYLKKPKDKSHLNLLKNESLRLKQKAVPTLIKVMKSSSYPEENRWVATYMLGRIMGKKSAPLISKFSQHPSWMLRLASLKVLLHLDQKQYKGIYARLLEDKSLIVRHQALQNIKQMEIKSLAPYVWKMLYNKKNYVGLKGKRKRSNIIKDAIKTVGDLGFKKAEKPMLEMFRKNKYKDVYEELDYALSRITKKDSPKGSINVKKIYWNRKAISEIII
jgi:hypothetical protein